MTPDTASSSSRRHWSELLVELLTELSLESGAYLVGEDEGSCGGDSVIGRLTIVHLHGRWCVVIEEHDSEPVLAVTDGTEKNTKMIWMHDDGQPFRDIIEEAFARWRRREDEDAKP